MNFLKLMSSDFFFYSLMYFNDKLIGTAYKTDNIKNMSLHVGQLRKVEWVDGIYCMIKILQTLFKN